MLAGSAWFLDRLPDLHNKDAVQVLLGKMFVELAEMDALHRSDAAAVKAFLTTHVDTFRPSYGRVAADHPRQCVFIATVNPGGSGYLRDETGARRFWPVTCSAQRVDIAAVQGARDQLWAEALHRYQAGEAWWLDTPELEAAQTAGAAERYDHDEWQTRLTDGLAGRAAATMADAFEVLGIPPREQTMALQKRLGAALRMIGRQRVDRRHAGVVRRLWVDPAQDAAGRGEIVEFRPNVDRADGRSTARSAAESLTDLMG
jgi:predicted P-loop ATPase